RSTPCSLTHRAGWKTADEQRAGRAAERPCGFLAPVAARLGQRLACKLVGARVQLRDDACILAVRKEAVTPEHPDAGPGKAAAHSDRLGQTGRDVDRHAVARLKPERASQVHRRNEFHYVQRAEFPAADQTAMAAKLRFPIDGVDHLSVL